MATKSWSPKELADHIKSICGAVVAEKLEPLNKRVTDYGTWIDGAKAGGGMQRPGQIPEGEKGLLVGSVVSALALGRCDLEKSISHLQKANKEGNSEVIKALEASTLTPGGVL